MQIVAQAWLVYRLTGSPVMLGVVEFLSRSPILVFGVLGGVVADRWPRRRLLMVAQTLLLLQATVLAVLTLTGLITIGWIMGLACLLGLVSVLEIPARQAFVTDLVPRSDIPSAIGLNASMFNAARVIGPTLAGLLVATFGEGICFLVNAVSYLVVIATLGVIRITPKHRPQHTETLQLLAEGLRYAWHTPHVRALLVLATLLSLAAFPFTTILPVFAVEILHGGPGSFGFLMAGTGIGALTAALYLARRSTVEGLDLAIARSVVCFAMGLLALAASSTLWVSAPALFVVGFGMVSSLAGANTLLQSLAPVSLRGRVVSMHMTVSLGMTIFGGLLAGTGAAYLGAPLTVAIGGLFTLAAALFFYSTLPDIRRHIRQHRLDTPEGMAS